MELATPVNEEQMLYVPHEREVLQSPLENSNGT